MFTITHLLLLIILTLVAYMHVVRRRNKSMPPGPPCFPVVGSLPYLGLNAQRSFRDLAARYGPVIYLKIGTCWTVVLNNYATVEEAFVKQSAKFSGRFNNFFTDLLADDSRGIFYMNTREKWHQHRRFVMKNLFGSSIRSQMEDLVLGEVRTLLDKIRDRVSTPYQISGDLVTSVSNIISQMMLSTRIDGGGNEKLHEFIKQTCVNCHDKAMLINLLYAMPWMRHIPGFGRLMAELKAGVESVNPTLERIIEEHEANFDPAYQRDFIDNYLAECRTNGETFDKRQLVQFLKDVFIAGTETSSSTLSWFLMMMVEHPDVQQKIHDEIDQVLGKDGQLSRNLDLPYTKAAIHEIFRVRTVVPLSIPRMTTENATVNGYVIPKGTQVIPNLWAVHNDPDEWSDPSRFDPTRHLSASGEFTPSRKIIPFSVGQRNCLGASLARMEIFLYTVGILQSFRVSANRQAAPVMDEVPGFLSSPTPYHFVFEAR